MPFFLIIVGIVLLTSSIRNTQETLFSTIQGDFVGQDNFLYWFLSIMVIGALGYIPSLEKLSRVFLALVVVTLFLSKQGFWSLFQQQVFGTGVSGANLSGYQGSATNPAASINSETLPSSIQGLQSIVSNF